MLNLILVNMVSGVSYNTIKRHLSVLTNEAINMGMSSNPMDGLRAKKTSAKLHKPYKI